MSARSLPPYGIELCRWLRADPKPKRWGCTGGKAAVTVAVGSSAWAWAKRWHQTRLVLCLPPGEYASRFDWNLCAGCDPVLLQECGTVSDGEVDNLVHALLRDGTKRALELATMDRFEAEAVCRAA